jgi:hypothetical protein
MGKSMQNFFPSYFQFMGLKISYKNSQDAPALMNGLRKCGIYTQWNFMQL